MRPMRYLALLALLTTVALSCSDAFAPPPGGVPFVPPEALYSAYWRQVETCSGLTGNWHRIRWFTVPGLIPTPGGDRLGVWDSPHTIYLVVGSDLVENSWLIPHEMLHDLTQRGAHGQAFTTCGL